MLPGLGPLTTIAMLLPINYALSPDAALIMLAGIYYGAQYGGSTTAIVVNLPGESSSVVTTIDGYQMARQGRAGVALSTAAIGSFFAGCVATLAIAALAAPLASVACAPTSRRGYVGIPAWNWSSGDDADPVGLSSHPAGGHGNPICLLK